MDTSNGGSVEANAPKTASNVALKSFARDVINYIDEIVEGDDSYEMLSRLIIVGTHGARNRSLVPRVESLAEDHEDDHAKVTMAGLHRVLPFFVRVKEDENGSKQLNYRKAAFEALLGPLLLRMILISNTAAIIATAPTFFAILFVFIFGEVESTECYVEAALTYLSWKAIFALVASLCRFRIHYQAKNWRLQAKAEKLKIIQQMQRDSEQFEEASSLLPPHLQQQLHEDHSWTHDHAQGGASTSSDHEDAGAWMQEMLRRRGRMDATVYGALRALSFYDRMHKTTSFLIISWLIPFSLIFDIVGVVLLADVGDCAPDDLYFLLLILVLISATTFFPRLITVTFWVSRSCCSAPTHILNRLHYIDQHDYRGIPFATTLYTVLFEGDRPRRTERALRQLERRIKDEREELTLKRQLHLQTMLDAVIFRSKSTLTEDPDDQEVIAAVPERKLRFRFLRNILRRRRERTSTGDNGDVFASSRQSKISARSDSVVIRLDSNSSGNLRVKRLALLMKLSKDLTQRIGDQFDDLVDQISELLDRDDGIEEALQLRPKAIALARDLLDQLELQRNFIAHQLRSEKTHFEQPLDIKQSQKLEADDFALKEREESVDNTLQELIHLADEVARQEVYSADVYAQQCIRRSAV
eukprot:TRINITY_DN12230_c0_g1_i18.p2 TRINITY_DN12230_c0_g1~~TRINITY_DN12230_c0_g1_i18.p2  ORF type:complete len:642 (+),score=135.23 TRINITY_DN12230_c0_g1_i18:43-1968(+)